MKKIIQKLLGLVRKRKESQTEDNFFRPIFFQFPTLLKKGISSGINVGDWGKDYLSKHKNIEKYIYEACEALQIYGISYTKHNKELGIYSDEELNNGIGEVVGRNFEIEARLTLRRTQELFIESWHFKEIKSNKENVFRHFFLIKSLKAFYSRENNLKKFCDLSSSFDVKVISEIRQELKNLNISTPFYISNNKDYTKDEDMVRLLKSHSKLFEEAIEKLSDGQKLIFGESYQSYAETSDVIHGYSGGPKFNLKNYHQEINGLYARIAVLASNILKHLALIGENCVGNNDLIGAINELKTDALPKSFLINIGDDVLVKRQVKAKVIEMSISKYGCKKYKVEYIDKRGDWSWSFEQEWFLLKDLAKLSS